MTVLQPGAQTTDLNAASLKPLMEPEAIAIIGASADPRRIGGRPIKYLIDGGFKGAIYPINPNREEIQGLKAYPSIAAAPDGIDMALVAVPAAGVLAQVDACIAKGVKSLLLFSSGFAEQDEEGAAMQAELTAKVRSAGVRLLGPNCLGLFNARLGYYPTFTSSLEYGMPTVGPVGIATQSGAYGAHMFALARDHGIGVKYWASTGNEAEIEVADIIDFYVSDPDVQVIMAYQEGVRNAPKLLAALDRAREARKPVLMMKVGRSAVGAAAAASHTASLAGKDQVFDAVFHQYGAFRVETTEEMLDLAYACTRRYYPSRGRLGIVTISGGAGVMMADAAEKAGLDVAPMPDDAQKALKELLPFAAVRNPVDITAQAINDMSLVQKNYEAMLARGGYDAILGFFTMVPMAPSVGRPLLDAIKTASEHRSEGLMVLSMIAPDDLVKEFEDDGGLVYQDATRAVNAIAGLVRIGRRFDQAPPEPLPALPATVEAPPLTAVAEHEAKRVLSTAGIPVVEEFLAGTAADAVEAARRMGGKVVLKIASPDIAHKTEIGGVLLNIEGDDAVADCHHLLLERAHAAKPEARIDGVLVAPMITDGVETILGIQRDPTFGPVVVFGLGGIFTEVFEDVTFRLAPFGRDEAHRMIEEIKGYPLLAGARGRPRADLDALADALAKLSVYAHMHRDRIESIDINPFLVRPLGLGAIAVDALIVPAG